MKDGARAKLELPLRLQEDLGPQNVAGQHVGGELNPREAHGKAAGEPFGEGCLAYAGDVFEQQVPARDQAGQRQLHLLGLPQHELADVVLKALEEFRGIEWHRFELAV